jgi:hypothetical protein
MAPAAAGSPDVVYISLPPGALSRGAEVEAVNRSSGDNVAAPIVEGGFGPAPIAAAVGDVLAFLVIDGLRPKLEWSETVPRRRPPVVVRTYPPRGKRDVPVASSLLVVFSEPVDTLTLGPNSIRLSRDGSAVVGRVRVAEDRLTVEFTPDQALAPGTAYVLTVGSEVRDLDGDPIGHDETVTFTTAGPPGYGSLVGTVHPSHTQPEQEVGGLVSMRATSPGQTSRFAWAMPSEEGDATRSFAWDSLPAGEWAITLSEVHPYTGVFRGMRLGVDTTVVVTVVSNQTVVVPEVELRPVAPFVLIATEVCPWSVPGPFTMDDWGNCDSGYWGGIDVEVEVIGIAGTATAGERFVYSIPGSRWFLERHDVPSGEYDVTAVPTPTTGTQIGCESGWQLVPWRQSTVRIRVDEGLAYAEFEYWCQADGP